MMWFDTWYKEVKQNSLQSTSSLKEHWKQFIPRITYKDLKRTIRAFLGIIQYVQMHHTEIHIIPKTMCQDDVENYFSLQRARISGGKPTTLQFFESSASLETELLLSSEMKDFQGNFGSYDLTALPNLVSLLYQNKNPHLAKTQQYSVKKKVGNHLLISQILTVSLMTGGNLTKPFTMLQTSNSCLDM